MMGVPTLVTQGNNDACPTVPKLATFLLALYIKAELCMLIYFFHNLCYAMNKSALSCYSFLQRILHSGMVVQRKMVWQK